MKEFPLAVSDPIRVMWTWKLIWNNISNDAVTHLVLAEINSKLMGFYWLVKMAVLNVQSDQNTTTEPSINWGNIWEKLDKLLSLKNFAISFILLLLLQFLPRQVSPEALIRSVDPVQERRPTETGIVHHVVIVVLLRTGQPRDVISAVVLQAPQVYKRIPHPQSE